MRARYGLSARDETVSRSGLSCR